MLILHIKKLTLNLIILGTWIIILPPCLALGMMFFFCIAVTFMPHATGHTPGELKVIFLYFLAT